MCRLDKPVHYRFTIEDINGGKVSGWSHNLRSIKRIKKHFDCATTVTIQNNRTGETLIWNWYRTK